VFLQTLWAHLIALKCTTIIYLMIAIKSMLAWAWSGTYDCDVNHIQSNRCLSVVWCKDYSAASE